MRFIKILIQAIIFIALILIIIQNEEVFTHEFQLGLDLEVWNSGTFVTSNIVLIAAAFLLGVILTILWGAFSSTSQRSKIKEQKRKIKELETSKPEHELDYSTEETISSEPHDSSLSNDPFKPPN
jgi:uncharacterized membrane protein YciS (DUF1049 family)